jgi:hypothetical protein
LQNINYYTDSQLIQHIEIIDRKAKLKLQERYELEFIQLKQIKGQLLELYADLVQGAAKKAYPDLPIDSDSLNRVLTSKLLKQSGLELGQINLINNLVLANTVSGLSPKWPDYFNACKKLDSVSIKPIISDPIPTFAATVKNNPPATTSQPNVRYTPWPSATKAPQPAPKSNFNLAPKLNVPSTKFNNGNVRTSFQLEQILFPCHKCGCKNHNAKHCSNLN